jgi:hypothetical protein
MANDKVITMEYRPPFTVQLEYFNENGKYRYSGEYKTEQLYMFEIFEEVRDMLLKGKRPGLVDGKNEYWVRVEVPHHPHNFPALIFPEVETILDGK